MQKPLADHEPSNSDFYVLKSSIRGEVNKKQRFTFGRIFVDFQPRMYSSRICSRFPLQRLGTLRTTA
jgi:hypothetical protein